MKKQKRLDPPVSHRRIVDSAVGEITFVVHLLCNRNTFQLEEGSICAIYTFLSFVVGICVLLTRNFGRWQPFWTPVLTRIIFVLAITQPFICILLQGYLWAEKDIYLNHFFTFLSLMVGTCVRVLKPLNFWGPLVGTRHPPPQPPPCTDLLCSHSATLTISS